MREAPSRTVLVLSLELAASSPDQATLPTLLGVVTSHTGPSANATRRADQRVGLWSEQAEPGPSASLLLEVPSPSLGQSPSCPVLSKVWLGPHWPLWPADRARGKGLSSETLRATKARQAPPRAEADETCPTKVARALLETHPKPGGGGAQRQRTPTSSPRSLCFP